jgi:plastocyanin
MGTTPPSSTGTTIPLVGAANLLLVALATLALGLTAALVGCGGGGGTDSTSSAGSPSSAAASTQGASAVTIKDYSFKPASITVPVGTTVKFTNEDSTPHTATSKQSGVFESGPIETGKTGSVKLEKAGTYAYYCAFHPFMKGTITVE